MEKASKFYIKYLPGDSSQFCIIYQKAPRIASFVTFKEKEGLELVACAETSSIALVLEDNHYNAAELPKTPIEWTEKGPFFIKLGLENTGFSWFLEKLGIRKAPPYIGMAECTEESKPKYKAVSPESINKSNPSLMLFTMHIQCENLSLPAGAVAGGSWTSAFLRNAVVGAYTILGAIQPAVGANLLVAGAAVSAKKASATSKISGLVGNNYNFPHTITANKMMGHYAHTV